MADLLIRRDDDGDVDVIRGTKLVATAHQGGDHHSYEVWIPAGVPTIAKCDDARIASIILYKERWRVNPNPGFKVIDEDYDTFEDALRSCVGQALR